MCIRDRCTFGTHAALLVFLVLTVVAVSYTHLDVYKRQLSRLRAHALALDGEVLLGVELMDEAGVHDEAARRRDPDFAAMLASPTRATKLGIANDGSDLQTVDAVSGALMLLPRTLFDRLAGFDEGYRLHAEDLDLCRRARVAGATVAIANDIRVLHVRGVSSRARPLFVEWHKHRGLWRYFRKFEATRRSVFTSVAVLAIIWLRFFMVFVRKSTTTGQGKSCLLYTSRCV